MTLTGLRSCSFVHCLVLWVGWSGQCEQGFTQLMWSLHAFQKLLSIFNRVKLHYQVPVNLPSRLKAVQSCAQSEAALTGLSLHGILLS